MSADKGIRDKKHNSALIRELNKIESVKRSGMRMLETGRRRFGSKFKRFQVPQLSSGSDAIDVRMYDTHNPGFCYHCTGAIKACKKSQRKNFVDIFDTVYSMLFTDGEVDTEKIICLHVLTAHYAKSGPIESEGIRPITPFFEKDKAENFSGAWNNLLPCYVVEIQNNVDADLTNFSDELKRHKDLLVTEAEDEVVRDFERKYEKYLRENSEVGLALSANEKRTKMVPDGIGKTIIIPPHVYSLLGAAQELRIKQAVAEESSRKRFRRSDSSVKNVDNLSTSFRLEDEEDTISRRLMTNTSIRGWNGITKDFSKVLAFRSFSNYNRRSGSNSLQNTEPCSITTLKPVSLGSTELPGLVENNLEIDKQIVTIKPSTQAMMPTVSKTSSTRSPFHNFSRSPCSNSIVSGISGSLEEPRKIRRPIFINSPVTNFDLQNKKYKTVPILVNNQIQALIHSVMNVLDRVNPTKSQKIVSMASNPSEIRKMLTRPDIQPFIDSLAGQPLVSSPNSFVVSMASILDDIDPRIENSIEKELVATTLTVPLTAGLHRLVNEIRSNIFTRRNKTAKSKMETDVEISSFESQKGKLLESKYPSRELEEQKDVFDINTSCPHTDVQGNKTKCACCYAKWKNSLLDVKRMRVPHFSFQITHEDPEMSPESTKKYESQEAVVIQAMEVNASELPAGQPETAMMGSCHPGTDLHVADTEYSQSPINEPKKGTLLTARRSTKLKQSEQILATQELVQQTQKKNFSETEGNAELSMPKIQSRQIKEVQRSYKGSTSISNSTVESLISESPWNHGGSKNSFHQEEALSPKYRFKPWKVSHAPSYLDPDRVILRRMTNQQRILVGQMCASLKTRKINMEGLVKERTPLAAIITPALSHETLKILTLGTRQVCGIGKRELKEEIDDCVSMSETLTGPVLAKVRQAVAELETERKLISFLKDRI